MTDNLAMTAPPIKVLHILDHSLPLHSGYSFRTRAILKSLIAWGIDVRGLTGLRHRHDATCGFDSQPDQVDGLEFYRTGGQVSGLPLAREWGEITRLTKRIIDVCQSWRPDVIHAHSPALCGMAGLRASRALMIPFVYEIRAFWEDAAVSAGARRAGSPIYRLTRALENHVVARADAVVTICSGLRDDLVSRGICATRVTIVPNGVDLALLGAPIAPDQGLRADLGLGDGPVIGFIGSFYDYEGLDDLIAAMPMLIARHADARLMLVGGGPCEEAIRTQAAASPVAQAIRFVGRVPHTEVERYYALCDIMAYPRKASRLTDLVTPLKPLEAMAQGKLVAASDVGGHRELISDGVTGSLFPADDPLACAQALARLLDDRGRWDEMRQQARDHVEQRHDWQHNAGLYREIYHRLLNSAPSGSYD